MKMNQRGHTNDEFCTPQYIFEQLDKIYKFDIDLATNGRNALCANYYTQEDNALNQIWFTRSFCNPPFSKKAYNEVMNGNCPVCVMILPLNCMDTKVWHEYIEGKFHYEILKGRIAFIDPETKQPKKGNNSGTVIVYFKKKVEI